MQNLRIPKVRFRYSIIILFYQLLLIWGYIYYVHNVYNYEGFILNLNSLKLIEGLVLSNLLSFTLPLNEKKPSTIALFILYIIVIIPISLIYSFKDESSVYFYGVIISFLITIFLVRNIKSIKFNIRFNLNHLIYMVFILITFIVLGDLIIHNGLPTLKLLDFSKVYEVRGNVKYGFPLLVYLITWLGLIINPFLMIKFLRNNYKMKFFIVLTSQIMLYLLTSHKTFVLFPLIIPVMLYILKKRKFIHLFSVGSVIGIVISMILYLLNITLWPAVLYLYRTLFLPAQLNYQYVEYFSENGFVMLSHSIFKFFFREPIYPIHPVRAIGQQYYYNNFPNTGYLADAYMNFGIPGMIIFSILFALVLKLIDSLSNTKDKAIISGAFMLITSTTLLNTGLLTTLLHGGVLLYIGILFLYREDRSLLK